MHYRIIVYFEICILGRTSCLFKEVAFLLSPFLCFPMLRTLLRTRTSFFIFLLYLLFFWDTTKFQSLHQRCTERSICFLPPPKWINLKMSLEILIVLTPLLFKIYLFFASYLILGSRDVKATDKDVIM